MNIFYSFCLYTSESDVCRRHILTYKDGPRDKGAKSQHQSDSSNGLVIIGQCVLQVCGQMIRS